MTTTTRLDMIYYTFPIQKQYNVLFDDFLGILFCSTETNDYYTRNIARRHIIDLKDICIQDDVLKIVLTNKGWKKTELFFSSL